MQIIENKDGCADGGIFNIGNPANDLSVRELAVKLIELVGEYPHFRDKAEKCRLVEVTSGEFYGSGYQDILTRVPSVRAAKEKLGWEPITAIDDALRKTLDFYLVEEKDKIVQLTQS